MREDDHEQFVVIINFASRPAKAGVEIPNAEQFQLMKINGAPGALSSDFSAMHLGGFEWRIYHRTIPEISATSAKPVSVR